jgi:SAM-dependent methyltransferase
MTQQYNDQIAKHYAAFRPELHGLILRRLVCPGEHFRIGLDIGCGTGYSAVALADHCDRVFGLEPSQPMLDQATIHPRVSYVNGGGEDLSVLPTKARLDLVSFAGSLFSAKTDQLKLELLRTMKPGGLVLVYDFQVLLEDFVTRMGVSYASTTSDYNYTENIYDWPEFETEVAETDQVKLELSIAEISHVLLADSGRFTFFQELFRDADPFDSLTKQIRQQDRRPPLYAEIYFSRHSLS